MNTYELIAPCHFGLESVLKREIYDLGYDISSVEDGKVTFVGDSEAICRANINLRTTERILIKVGQFKAETFTELFDNTKALEWENYIPKNGKFWVTKANSVNSKLFSSSDIQSIVKKAIVERLKEHYRIGWFEEDGDSYPIRVTIMKNELQQLLIDLEHLSVKGEYSEGHELFIYLSNIDFEATYTYVSNKDFQISLFRVYSINSMDSQSPQICQMQKNWIQSLKRHSTLISGSGEAQRIAFLEKQKSFIETL